MPTLIPAELRQEAAAALPALASWMAAADEASVRQWLADLGVLVAGNLSPDEARLKLAAFTSVLEPYPRACFTRKTLVAAARRFKFYPTFGELSEFLDETKGELRVKVDRLQRIARPQPPRRGEAAPEREADGPRTLTPETTAALERCKAALAEAAQEMRRGLR